MRNAAFALALALALALATAACGDNITFDPCAEFEGFERGGEGHADPLGAGPTEARAGRVSAADLPPTTLGFEVWQGGDFVLANDRVAMVIEDVGPSDLYDPWGGRPVGLAAIEQGRMVRAADFGEFFVLTGRYTVMTQSVSVLADGSAGGPAIIRATGFLSPLPFFEAVTAAILRDPFDGVLAAIDYILEPGAEDILIRVHYYSPRPNGVLANIIMHGYLFSGRMPAYAPGIGFGAEAQFASLLAFVDDDGQSYAYEAPGEDLGGGIAESGFSSNLTDGFQISGCEVTTRDHAHLILGGPGLDPLLEAVARVKGDTQREVSGVVRDSLGAPVAGARVHAMTPAGIYLTRASSAADGSYSLHVAQGAAVELFGYRRGEAISGPFSLAADEASADLSLAEAGEVRVTVTDATTGVPLPARIQALPVSGVQAPTPPPSFGEELTVSGRANVVYPSDGIGVLRLPAGDWEIVASRGYDYEIHREVVTVSAAAPVNVAAPIARVINRAGVLCADYHIHTIRSADGDLTAEEMAASAIADGLQILFRSDHEWVNSFAPAIEALGLGDFAFGAASVEMTSMEIWGHMGVLPIEPVVGAVNAGTPTWQRFPSAESPEVELELMNPVEVFAQVRARPEGSDLIINHPVGSTNYFGYAGLDLETAVPSVPAVWDESFTTIEAFNESSFRENRQRSVKAWFALLASGRPMFAVGSSDAHRLTGSGIGYPRTCLALGTSDPRALTAAAVAAATTSGHSDIVGGITVTASVAGAGPGETVTVGAQATLEIVVEAPTWVDVDELEIVVDGVSIETRAITGADADPLNPARRLVFQRVIDVAAAGSWVVVAAHGDDDLEPVTVGKKPFGVTNPIFLRR